MSREAPLDITLKNSAALFPESTALFGASRRLTAGRVEELPGFAQGGWWVQDAAATLPVLLLGDVRGKKVIDLCAAPGGKTMQLAAAGAEVIAVESDPARLVRLVENLARTNLTAALIEQDARDFKAAAPFVLIDAPCTASGTIRRHPDLPWIKEPGDVLARAPLAYDILESGAAMVAAGRPAGFRGLLAGARGRRGADRRLPGTHPQFARLPIHHRRCVWS